MKKSRDEVIFETLINKMLDPHGINIEDIRDSTTWFYDYTWSYKESLEYRKWAIDYLSKSKRTSKKLTELELRRAQIREKDYNLSDGDGLYFIVRKNGSKFFRLDFRYGGKRLSMRVWVFILKLL